MEKIKSKIRSIPDFPKPGIIYRDITTLLKDLEGFRDTINAFIDRYKNKKIDLVAGIESRGFLLAGAIAYELETGVVLMRKKGKLPHEKISQSYKLEYGESSIEIHKDSINKGDSVLVVDDLIATGGTLLAGTALVENLGGVVYECAAIIDLPDLGGKRMLEDKGYKVFNLVSF